MNKDTHYKEKLEKIKNDHRLLLEMARSSIAENANILGEQIHDIFSVIEYDEKQSKKYAALLNAKCTIENIVESIVNATTYEEIVKLREKLNYYINKIKKEMVSRNLSDEMIASYQKQTSYLKKDIAKSIRILKRENNIDTIEGLIMLSDVIIPDDDDETLKKMIKNEMKFNNYYLKPKKLVIPNENDTKHFDEDMTISQQPVEKKSSKADDIAGKLKFDFTDLESPQGSSKVITELNDFSNGFKPLLTEAENPNKKSNNDGVEKNDDLSDLLKPRLALDTFKYSDETEYLQEMVKRYTRQYCIRDLRKYGHSKGNNVLNFIGNLPTYIYNKQAVREMEYDSSIFYSGSDFVSFIEYTRRRNSISNALKSVFNKSYLISFEGNCLNNHERCVRWMQAYCKENGLEVNYLSRSRLLNI